MRSPRLSAVAAASFLSPSGLPRRGFMGLDALYWCHAGAGGTGQPSQPWLLPPQLASDKSKGRIPRSNAKETVSAC